MSWIDDLLYRLKRTRLYWWYQSRTPHRFYVWCAGDKMWQGYNDCYPHYKGMVHSRQIPDIRELDRQATEGGV